MDEEDVEELLSGIKEEFGEHFVDKMPVDLIHMRKKMESITFASKSSGKLRNSKSEEENATFLFRWSRELYPKWSSKLYTTF